MSSDASVLSRMSSTTMNDARVVSRATSTATIAAKSILSSGGNEETALKTAQAAAQSVLLQQCTTSSDPKTGPLRRRKIKKKAEVVASMALANAIHNITLPGSEQDSDDVLVRVRELQIQLEELDNRSTMSGYSSVHGDSTLASTTPRKSGPLGSMNKKFSSLLGGVTKMATVQEERPPRSSRRPVNITIENQGSPNWPKGDESSRKVKVKGKGSKETKSSQGTSKDTRGSQGSNNVSKIGDIHIPRNHCASSKIKMILSPSRERKASNELTTTLSADDPIYYMGSRHNSVQEGDRYESLNLHSSSISFASDDEDTEGPEEESMLDDEETVESHDSLNTYDTVTTHRTQRSFMEKSEDSCLFDFWACGSKPKTMGHNSSFKKIIAPPANLATNGSDVSSVASDELLRGLRSEVIANYSGVLEGSILFEKREASVTLVEDPDTREDIEGIIEDISGSHSTMEASSSMNSGKKAAAWKKFKRVVRGGKRQMSEKSSVTITPAASASAE